MQNRNISGVLGKNWGPTKISGNKIAGKKKISDRPIIKMGVGLALLLGIVACQTTEPPAVNTTISQPEMTPLEQRASAYVQFRADIDLLAATVVDSDQATRDAHNRLASHSPDMLSSGWVAYAALVAADDPAFAKSVQDEMVRMGGRDPFLSAIRQNPSMVLNFAGSDAAIDDILQFAAADATKIKTLSEVFISEAYSLQKVGWAKRKISPGMSRVDSARSWSYSRSSLATPYLPASMSYGVVQPGLASADALWTPSWGNSAASFGRRASDATPILARALNLAARYSVGDVDKEAVATFARNDRANKCLANAKMNLDQCIAATRTPYEEMFCLGKHGLGDVSSCVGHVASVDG